MVQEIPIRSAGLGSITASPVWVTSDMRRHLRIVVPHGLGTGMRRNSMKTQILLAATAAAIASMPASADIIYGLTTQNSIAVIDSAMPSDSIDGGFVMGLGQNENLLEIDYRPGTGELYAISSQDNVYTIDLNSFEANLVGNFTPPSLRGTSYAFDFNNAFDGGSGLAADIGRFARIISDTDNNRVIDGDTGQYLGTPEKTPVFYPAGDPSFGVNPNIVGIGYTNAFPGAQSTQQYGIDRATGNLVTVANNAGTLNTVGSLGVTGFTNEAELDISGDNVAFAVLQNGPSSVLYTVDLGTGAATPLGDFASGDLIRSLAVVPVPEPTTAAVLGLGALGMLRRRR